MWGDFKVKFKLKDISFYFWLNVSAILYNSDLRKISEKYPGDREVPIHFEEFVEVEDSDSRVRKGEWSSLILPKGKEHQALDAKGEDHDAAEDNSKKHEQEI